MACDLPTLSSAEPVHAIPVKVRVHLTVRSPSIDPACHGRSTRVARRAGATPRASVAASSKGTAGRGVVVPATRIAALEETRLMAAAKVTHPDPIRRTGHFLQCPRSMCCVAPSASAAEFGILLAAA